MGKLAGGSVKQLKQLSDIALLNTSSQSYRTSLAIWDHSVTLHPTQVNAPRLTLTRQASIQYSINLTPEGWKAELT